VVTLPALAKLPKQSRRNYHFASVDPKVREIPVISKLELHDVSIGCRRDSREEIREVTTLSFRSRDMRSPAAGGGGGEASGSKGSKINARSVAETSDSYPENKDCGTFGRF